MNTNCPDCDNHECCDKHSNPINQSNQWEERLKEEWLEWVTGTYNNNEDNHSLSFWGIDAIEEWWKNKLSQERKTLLEGVVEELKSLRKNWSNDKAFIHNEALQDAIAIVEQKLKE